MLRGRCACNVVAFEVSDEFVVAYNCHCSNCRATTGSAFLPWGEIEPEKLRVTIVLASIEGHDVREVSALLGIPEGTVKSRLFLARQQLKGLLR